jgi:hypothetical protein
MLQLLQDTSEPAELRRTALQMLQLSSFNAPAFPSRRPEYLAALRSLVDDKDAELRQEAIAILAKHKDEFAQRRLLEGLEGTAKAVVPPAKAIQLLGYDVHADHYPVLRKIVQEPPSVAAQAEAVRLLAADSSSKDLLTGVLSDKSKKREVRRASAIALQTLAPKEFEAQAKKIVLDDDEDDALRAASITALTQFSNPAELTTDAALNKQVEKLGTSSSSKLVKQASRRYMAKSAP